MSAALGPFEVRASAADAAAFRTATGLAAAGPILPLTYPIRWLVTPEIREALVAMVPEPDLVLVHESQSFDYQMPLRSDVTYRLSLSARREVSPDRMIVDGVLTDTDGTTCAGVETVLRLFSTDAAAA